MIAKALQFMAEVADANELTLDPAMDTYYFMDTVVSKCRPCWNSWGSPGRAAPGADQEGTGAPDEDRSGVTVAVMGGLLRARTSTWKR